MADEENHFDSENDVDDGAICGNLDSCPNLPANGVDSGTVF